MQTDSWQKGLRDGVPICLGYIPVSFTFGMMAASGGLPFWITELISLTNVTSAGQFAGTALILSGGMYAELMLAMLIINLRYMLMSFSLSQKFTPSLSFWKRAASSFMVTDEIFAVAASQPGYIGVRYFFGLASLPYFGWAFGTLLGALAANLLPASLASALNIAIYGMFIAIVVPPMKKSRPAAFTVLLSVALSCFFRFTPGLKALSSGWIIIICTMVSATAAALIWPHPPEDAEGGGL